MSLDKAVTDLIAALDRNTAAHLNGAAPAPAPVKPARAAKPAVDPAPAVAAAPAAAAPAAAPATARLPTADTAAAVTPAQIKAAGDDLTILANELNARDQAVAILAEFGVQKMTAMPPANIPEFHARVKAAIAKLKAPEAVSLV